MKSTSHSLPLALVPAWNRLEYWVLFAAGAAWGAVLGSALVGKPLTWFVVAVGNWFTISASGHGEHQLVHGVAAASRTPVGAPLIMLGFTLGSALLVASSGTQWLRERAHDRALGRTQVRTRERRLRVTPRRAWQRAA